MPSVALTVNGHYWGQLDFLERRLPPDFKPLDEGEERTVRGWVSPAPEGKYDLCVLATQPPNVEDAARKRPIFSLASRLMTIDGQAVPNNRFEEVNESAV